jgi:hypothetical protein
MRNCGRLRQLAKPRNWWSPQAPFQNSLAFLAELGSSIPYMGKQVKEIILIIVKRVKIT